MTSRRKRLKKLAQSIGIQRNDFDSWHYTMSIGAYDLYADPLDYHAIIDYIRDYQKRWPIKIVRGKRAEVTVIDYSINKDLLMELIKDFKFK